MSGSDELSVHDSFITLDLLGEDADSFMIPLLSHDVPRKYLNRGATTELSWFGDLVCGWSFGTPLSVVRGGYKHDLELLDNNGGVAL